MSYVSDLYRKTASNDCVPLNKWSHYRSSFTCLFYELACYADMVRFIREQTSSGVFYGNILFVMRISAFLETLEYFETQIGAYLPTTEMLGSAPRLPLELPSPAPIHRR